MKAGPHLASKQEDETRLTAIEEEMARRLEAGESIKGDAELFKRLHTYALSSHRNYPYRIWFLFFNEELIAKITRPDLKPSPNDRAAFNYLTTVLDPSWSLRAASALRGDQGTHGERIGRREQIPKALLETYDAAVNGPLPNRYHPWRGVVRLTNGECEESKGQMLADVMLKMGRKFLGELKGKDLADVGAGCGPTLKLYREALGPTARLIAEEVDPFSIHVIKALHRDLKVEVLQGDIDDVRLPPQSVDIITMNSVHLGLGLEKDVYSRITLPWLKSMTRALRPGGIMIIEDSKKEPLQLNMVKKVETAGLENILFRLGPKQGLMREQWVAVFKRP